VECLVELILDESLALIYCVADGIVVEGKEVFVPVIARGMIINQDRLSNILPARVDLRQEGTASLLEE